MSFTSELSDLFAETVSRLPSVVKKRMFGCDAFFRSGQIFGLIWKTGRLGVRLPDEAQFKQLMAYDGSEPWQVYDKPGAKPMAHWVLVPEAFHDDTADLAQWIGLAYQLAAPNAVTVQFAKKPSAAKPANKAVANKAVAKKASAKKAVAKKASAKKAVAKKASAKKAVAKKAGTKKPGAKTVKKAKPKSRG